MWEEKELLVCVKTYPEYSSKYVETVCTAAIARDTRQLIRLYPLPYRYLFGEQQFQKYQWITAKIKKNQQDSRPESYRVKSDSIRLGSVLGTEQGWRKRNEWILANPAILFSSLEDLQAGQEDKGISLGLIKPMRINNFYVEAKSKTEIDEAIAKKESILKQRSLWVEKKNLEIIRYRFMLNFTCDSTQCKGHNISILDWEFGELYRKNRRYDDWEKRMKDKSEQIYSDKHDTYLFMGNLAGRRKTFCILGFYYPHKGSHTQLRIF